MLGPLEVRTDGDPGQVLEVGGVRLRALLIMLALRPGQFAPASQLIDGLWAEAAPAGAANALQALVSRLRRALPDAVIESRPAGYQLALDPQATDIARFEQLTAAGRARLSEDPEAAAAILRRALALWRGPALVDVAETDFGRAAIARLDELRLATLEHRIDAELRTPGQGHQATLVAELEGLVIAHPMREPLAGLLMRALLASGRRGSALEVYEQTRQRLVEQLGVEPSADLAGLHLEILRADDPLAPVTDPADVTSAVLGALGLREQALLYAGRTTASFPPRAEEQADALGRLLAALTRQQALLVLDNCEHLVTAAATLADRVLAACPRVRILATSREPLNITGEALWTVGPLTLPPDPAVTPSFYAERAGPGVTPPTRGRRVADPQRRNRSHPGFRLGPPAGPARRRRPPGLRGHRGQRGRRGQDLPGARRHAAGHRAGRGAAAHHGPGTGRHPPRRPVPAADRGRAHHGAQAPDAAGGRRLELGPAR